MKLLIVGLLLVSMASVANVYKWVDENGVTHYSQTKPETTNETEEIRVKGLPKRRDPNVVSVGTEFTSTSTPGGNAADVDCEKVVKHGLNLMAEDFKKESGGANNPMLAMLKDPAVIKEGVDECTKDLKDPEKAAVWACQMDATSFKGIQACEG